MLIPNKLFALCALLATLLPLVPAHSWVEEYQVISDNGTYTGAVGYTRGYVPRTDPTFNGFSMLWLLPDSTARNSDQTTRTRINSTDLVCPPQQRTSNYTATYPKLQVSPGDYVAMKYLENGHTTLPWNITGKPAGGGTVFVFGTTSPSDTETIADVMEWNTDGTSGNKRGFLLTAQNFDDGRCHQINCGSISQQRQMMTPNHVAGQNTSSVESWCESDVKIPANQPAGTLTTYWIWQWPTAPNVDCNTPAGKDEYYTSCADFDVVAAGSVKNAAVAVASDAPAGNPQSVAVSDYKSRTAFTTSPSVVLMNNNKLVGSVAPVQTAFASACTIQQSIISANTLSLWPEVFVPNSCSVVTSFGSAAASSAAAEYNKAAEEYTVGSKAAWSAAYANAGVPMQTPVVWSAAFSTMTAAPVATSATAYTPAVTTSAPAYMPAVTTVPSMVTDFTTVVVVVTQTLPPGVPIPTISTVGRRHPRHFD
jgi:hypothetical protein